MRCSPKACERRASAGAVPAARVTEHARIVIGADGLRSHVARAVQAPAYDVRSALTCAYYSYWSGVPLAGVSSTHGRAGPSAPAPRTTVRRWSSLLAARSIPRGVRADIERSFLEALEGR